jgi:hypothetical protein
MLKLLLVALVVAVSARSHNRVFSVRTSSACIAYGVEPDNNIDPNSIDNLGFPNSTKPYFLPKFDTRLGVLTSVEVTFDVVGAWHMTVVNGNLHLVTTFGASANITVFNDILVTGATDPASVLLTSFFVQGSVPFSSAETLSVPCNSGYTDYPEVGTAITCGSLTSITPTVAGTDVNHTVSSTLLCFMRGR